MFGMTDEEFMRNQREMFYDRKFEATLEVIGEAEQASVMGASPPAPEGDILGGEPLPGEEGEMPLPGAEADTGAPEADAEGGEEEGETGEEDVLLATPGKRKDMAPRITAGSKGKVYTPVASDRRQSAGRKKQMKGSWNHETSQNTTRNISAGSSDLLGLGRGIYEEVEEVDSNYKEEEKRLFEVNQDIKRLISGLGLREEKDETKA